MSSNPLCCLCKGVAVCLAGIFCDFLCCECNCCTFPSESPSYTGNSLSEDPVRATILSFNKQGKQIPYLEVSTIRSRQSRKCVMFFHGNAQDLGQITKFLIPIVQSLDITFYAIEYPTYSYYSVWFPALISNTIKADSLAFYDFILKDSRSSQDIYVMGRSIGTGGATYLSARKDVPYLVLLSPFDTTRSVGNFWFGCIGGVIKQHFDNISEIVKFKGDLLAIHGQADTTIPIQLGKNLVEAYNKGNASKKTAATLYPPTLTHSNFVSDTTLIETFITAPMRAFFPK